MNFFYTKMSDLKNEHNVLFLRKEKLLQELDIAKLQQAQSSQMQDIFTSKKTQITRENEDKEQRSKNLRAEQETLSKEIRNSYINKLIIIIEVLIFYFFIYLGKSILNVIIHLFSSKSGLHFSKLFLGMIKDITIILFTLLLFHSVLLTIKNTIKIRKIKGAIQEITLDDCNIFNSDIQKYTSASNSQKNKVAYYEKQIHNIETALSYNETQVEGLSNFSKEIWKFNSCYFPIENYEILSQIYDFEKIKKLFELLAEHSDSYAKKALMTPTEEKFFKKLNLAAETLCYLTSKTQKSDKQNAKK